MDAKQKLVFVALKSFVAASSTEVVSVGNSVLREYHAVNNCKGKEECKGKGSCKSK